MQAQPHPGTATDQCSEFGKSAVAVFLSELSRTGNIHLSCDKARLTRQHIRELETADKDFAKAILHSLEDAHDILHAEARRRALGGTPMPVISAGKIVIDRKSGKVIKHRKYSDSLLKTLLSRNCVPSPAPKVAKSHDGESRKDVAGMVRQIAEDSDPAHLGNPA